MIRLSAGTARVLGFNTIEMESPPTCAYLMLGTRCDGVCKFCAQSSVAKESDYLSRITWKPEEDAAVWQAMAKAYESGDMKRACFQVVQKEDSFDTTLANVKALKQHCDIPVCVSINGISLDQMAQLFEAGTQHVAFSFDAATPELFREIKRRDWDAEWTLYEEAIKRFPGGIVIHLIVGMGETEEDVFTLLAQFAIRKTPVSLFAFTPLPGTPMKGKKPPSISSYRRLQAAYYLMRSLANNCVTCRRKKDSIPTYILQQFISADKTGRLVFAPTAKNYLLNTIPGDAFQTYGCKDCNRPLYNEKPGRTPYNYPRPLTEEERIEAIEAIFDL